MLSLLSAIHKLMNRDNNLKYFIIVFYNINDFTTFNNRMSKTKNIYDRY